MSSKPHHNGGNTTASGQALKERFLKLLLALVFDTAATLGLAKTHLQHVMTATAINLKRLFAWVQGIPLAGTRISSFAALNTVPG
ncbi:hypothetical protein [Moorena producens]|uniref:hypothetical protein n=1 Tax=Moorena producens TaxID=1155739 RepID=UPI001930ED99|nr:hypothetical protein [Moorena producens]